MSTTITKNTEIQRVNHLLEVSYSKKKQLQFYFVSCKWNNTCLLCVCDSSYTLNVVRQTTKTAKTQASGIVGLLRSRVEQGLCMSDTTDLIKGGVHICSYLMWACWRVSLFLACMCWYVRTFPKSMGPHWQYYSRKHMFTADRAGERGDWTELNSCTKETKRKLVCCCCPGSEAQLGG